MLIMFNVYHSQMPVLLKRGKYHKLSDELCAQIGEYPCKYGNNATVLKLSLHIEKPSEGN